MWWWDKQWDKVMEGLSCPPWPQSKPTWIHATTPQNKTQQYYTYLYTLEETLQHNGMDIGHGHVSRCTAIQCH